MERILRVCLLFLVSGTLAFPQIDDADESIMHPTFTDDSNIKKAASPEELTADYWNQLGKDRVRMLINQENNLNQAKNVIFFLGDGMSIPTLAAARAYMGQLNGANGEESQLSFEKFPYTGLSKTYCVDRQVADSACSATAYLGGVKANYGTIGVSGEVRRSDCARMMDNTTHVHSLAKLFTDNGKSAGILTTTRVTHASPAGAYAHTANREWESDVDIVNAGFDVTSCRDIAHQLMYGDPGTKFKVILGGGRREMLPTTVVDEEGRAGRRTDGRNLIEEWRTIRANQSQVSEYVWNREQLLNLDEETDYLLGLFESDHCKYHLEVTDDKEPTFEEMVEAAIKVLSKDKNGYFLFAEGGRIDHAHHGTYAKLALDETVEFSKGIEKAVSMVNLDETLIVVTSDHAHTMALNGYPTRGNPITDPVNSGSASDGLRYMTLSYSNGPGYRKEVDGQRVDVANLNRDSPRFQYPALVPLSSETHGGDDVAVFANGPWQHLFRGVYEQSSIPHLITYATCLDKDLTPCWFSRLF